MSTEAGLTQPQGRQLTQLARAAIAQALAAPTLTCDLIDRQADWLQQPAATFVTLTQQGRLRGCIGSLVARRALLIDVQANAVAAALQDSRFAPLTPAELGATQVEVSVLSAQQPMLFDSQAQALALLQPGVDGVVLACGRFRSTFLPQVWEQLPSPAVFLAHLKQKAGLPADFWSPELRLSRYTVAKFKEAQHP